MAELPKRMTVGRYLQWMSDPNSKKASEKDFFPNGVRRTLNILRGKASKESVNKWKSFGKRHYAQYKKNPTSVRRYAIRNWGFALPKSKKEKFTG